MFAQIARVDEVLREKGWSLRVADDLAKELGVDRRTVYRLRNRANRWTQDQLRPQDVERWRARQLQLADEAARSALSKGDYTGAAALLKVAGSLAGTITPPGVKVDVNIAQNVTLSAAIARVSALEPEQLEERRRLAMEATFVEVPREAEAETVPVEPADVPPRAG